MAKASTKINTRFPLPIKAKIGPGQAPVMAQPRPKISPPIIVPQLSGFPARFMVSPSLVLA